MSAFRVTSIIYEDTLEASSIESGTVRPEPESVSSVTMLGDCTPPKVRNRRMLCQSLSMGSRLNSGPLTKWIGVDWSAKCLSGAETLLSFS